MTIRLAFKKKYSRKVENYYIDHLFLSENILKFVTRDDFSFSVPMEDIKYLFIETIY